MTVKLFFLLCLHTIGILAGMWPCGIIMFIGERSEPLSRVFNEQPCGIYIYMVESVRTYVSNSHAHVRMSVCY